jgi:hypothetical protein
LGELKDIVENPTYGAIPIFMWEKALSTGVIDFLREEDKKDFVYVYGIMLRHQKNFDDDAELLASGDKEVYERHALATQGLLAVFYIVAENLLQRTGIRIEETRYTGTRFFLGLLQDTSVSKRLYLLTALQYLRKEDISAVLDDIRVMRTIIDTLEVLSFEELRLLFSILIRGGMANAIKIIDLYKCRHTPEQLLHMIIVLRAAYRVGMDVSPVLNDPEVRESIDDGILKLSPDDAKRILRYLQSMLSSGRERSMITFKPGADRSPLMKHNRDVPPDFQERSNWIKELYSKVYSRDNKTA